jgi:Carbohydrate-binding family 9
MHVSAQFWSAPLPLQADFTGPGWQAAVVHSIDRTWRGDLAPSELATTARVVWTLDDLWFGFECHYRELDADADADVDTTVERPALWERDVCEAFVRSPSEPRLDSYKEFEVAPTGQWCDLAIHRPRLDVDITWQSGMTTAATVDAEAGVWRAVMRIPFSAFGRTPMPGDHWHVNLFRIGRVNGERRYLAYAPTRTDTPDFHVPERFVPLTFVR